MDTATQPSATPHQAASPDDRHPRFDTPAETPPLSLLLAYGPALVLPALAVLAWVVPTRFSVYALALGTLWGASILVFLAGVRRGLSFFTEGGPRAVQIGTMMWLFLAGLVALLLPPRYGFLLLALGYASIAILDPRAAGRGEVPRYFSTLRPPQMTIAVLGLLGLFARTFW